MGITALRGAAAGLGAIATGKAAREDRAAFLRRPDHDSRCCVGFIQGWLPHRDHVRDGKAGVVDFAPYLRRGGVFERFRDLSFFRQFRVDPELGALTWADEIDIAPETLYALATGAPLPEWMTAEEARL